MVPQHGFTCWCPALDSIMVFLWCLHPWTIVLVNTMGMAMALLNGDYKHGFAMDTP